VKYLKVWEGGGREGEGRRDRKFLMFIKAIGITDVIKHVLSGRRREALKVTAYKEMIRLLSSMPSSKHISMIETEWKRKELHR
jgi:hypothetical protein